MVSLQMRAVLFGKRRMPSQSSSRSAFLVGRIVRRLPARERDADEGGGECEGPGSGGRDCDECEAQVRVFRSGLCDSLPLEFWRESSRRPAVGGMKARILVKALS